MARHLHLDFETFSEIDIRDVGAYRYAFDPSTEILCAAMAFDDEEPVIWHAGLDEFELWELEPYFDALEDPSVLIYAHNSMFESAICQALLQKTWGIPAPALDRFRCTMSLARRASLPGKLEKLAEVLHLGNQKDTRGKSLLKKFSMMQPPKRPTKAHPQGLPARRIRPQDDPAAFAELLEYCKQDVRAEQEAARKLAYFGDALNDANYVLDQRINARGVPVNLQALRHAQKLIDEETEIVSAKFRELTGFEVTQNAVLLKWVNENGYSFENLQAETVDSFLDQHEREIKFYIHPESSSCYTAPADQEQEFDGCLEEVDEDQFLAFEKEIGSRKWAVVVALRLKQSIAYASIKKVKTMLECAGPHDNRIRGMLNHHGATTGRWTASLVQFQNMKRPTIKHSEDAYREICEGVSREMLELCYGPVLEVISSCIRHFVHDVKETRTKHVVNFSGGLCSFWAAFRVVQKYGSENVVLLFADTMCEDEDLYTFNQQASALLGCPLMRVADGRDPWQLFSDEGLIANNRFPICSTKLKRKLLDEWREQNCDPQHTIVYAGFDWTEAHRVADLQRELKGWKVEAPMIEEPIWDKCRMQKEAENLGLVIPSLYQEGFPHNNCGGRCVKAGISHWVHLLKMRPKAFQEWEEKELTTAANFSQRGIKALSILRDRRGGVTNDLWLRDLRLRVEAGEQFTRFDWGGCGCGGAVK